jgi:Ala-tRNA(Pro) deacylase
VRCLAFLNRFSIFFCAKKQSTAFPVGTLFFFFCPLVVAVGEKEKDSIVRLLESSSFSFDVLVHEPVFTSEQAAKVRGVSLQRGVKAMVLQSDSGKFFLFCLPADKRIDFKKAALLANEKHVSLADPKEVLQRTGCEIGSVSPFSGLLSGIPTFFDSGILGNEVVEFNIGLHTHSVRMKSSDLAELVKPELGNFATKK